MITRQLEQSLRGRLFVKGNRNNSHVRQNSLQHPESRPFSSTKFGRRAPDPKDATYLLPKIDNLRSKIESRKGHQRNRLESRVGTEEQEEQPLVSGVAARAESRLRIKTEIEGAFEGLGSSRAQRVPPGEPTRGKVRRTVIMSEDYLPEVDQPGTGEGRLKRLAQKEFVYLVKNEGHDHYNLSKIDFKQIVRRGYTRVYFTLSIKGITRYQNALAREFIPLEEWLAERDKFNQIKQLSFFTKFRKWRVVKQWTRILARDRAARTRAQLKMLLFPLNRSYRKILLSHRSACCDIERLRFVDNENSDTYQLSEFRVRQRERTGRTIQGLKYLSSEMHKGFTVNLDKVIQDFREIINKKAEGNEQLWNSDEAGEEKASASDARVAAYHQLGFNEHMNYGNKYIMRTEFKKFLRLAYLLDFMALNALSSLFLLNVKDVLARYQAKLALTQPLPVLPLFQGVEGERVLRQATQPIFNVHFSLVKPQLPPQHQLSYYTIKEIHKNPLLFDFEAYHRLASDREGLLADEDDDEQRGCRFFPAIQGQLLGVSPSAEQILQVVQELFAQGQEAIQAVGRWSKSEQFLPFVNSLQDYDTIIGENWGKPESKYLNPSAWIREYPLSRDFIFRIRDFIREAFARVEAFISEHNRLLSLFYRLKTVPLTLLEHPRLQNQGGLVHLLLKSAVQVRAQLAGGFAQEVDLGLLKVTCHSLSRQILPQVDDSIQGIADKCRQIFKEKCGQLEQWFKASIGELSGVVINIEEFIRKKNNLEKISQLLVDRKEQANTALDIFYHLEEVVPEALSKEDRIEAEELSKLDAGLASSISEVDSYINKNLEKNRKLLTARFERLLKDCQQLNSLIGDERFSLAISDAKTVLEQLNVFLGKAEQLEKQCAEYMQYEDILQHKEFKEQNSVRQVREAALVKQQLWEGILVVEEAAAKWREMPLTQVPVKPVVDLAESMGRRVIRAERLFSESKATQRLRRVVWQLKEAGPILAAIAEPALLEEHWASIRSILKAVMDVRDEAYLFGELMGLSLKGVAEEVCQVAQSARQEEGLRSQLDSMESQWVQVDLKIKSYREGSDLFVIYEIDELFVRLDEGLATVSAVLSSKFVAPLRPRAEKNQMQLLQVQEIIEKWVECQKKWLYLQNIFAGPDMRKSLPQASKDFETCDKTLKGLLKRMYGGPKVMRLLKIANLMDSLGKVEETLARIEFLLQDYLQIKRKYFPRFYFLSNDELLLILSRPNPVSVQLHISKCFEGAAALLLERETLLLGVLSPEGERLQLANSFTTKSSVEIWLQQLQKGLHQALKKAVKVGLMDLLAGAVKSRQEWIAASKGQVVSVVSQILWCVNTEESINQVKNKPSCLTEWYQESLLQLNKLSGQVAGKLEDLLRRVLVVLITAEVHNRDILNSLVMAEVSELSSFEWQKQLRYVYDEEKEECQARQGTSVLPYGYEYLGVASRLVITPLTERCWLTITSALAHQLGASPAGPAGTGKTQSTKDLAKGLARICIVFNCSDQITTQMTSRLFTGLASQGAWACLDQFNRIDIEVLSVIAQQLQSIRNALLLRSSQFELDGKEVELRGGYGCFVTMNPGYAGRTELPDNLKSLFRPVAMMIPDYAMIAEIMLFAEGFEEAEPLSKKMVQLYKLSSEQLSPQDHYDFGMRAVKSLLLTAGALKRERPGLPQEELLIAAMRDSNLPKFTAADIPLFQNLIRDLFPNFAVQQHIDSELETAVTQDIERQGLLATKGALAKVIQLKQTLAVRFGVMVVGQAMSGKTSTWTALARTSNRALGQTVLFSVLNPKCITIGQLYGEVEAGTGQWRDGLASSIIRRHNQPGLDEPDFDMRAQRWVVFDGPVDALWIENLNTVLDDNKTLCLASSQRIKLRDQLRMLFQVENLAVASPATVSRCGMVFTSETTLGWQDLLRNWVRTLTYEEKLSQHIQSVCERVMQGPYSKVAKMARPYAPTKARAMTCLLEIASHLLKGFKPGSRLDQDMKKANYLLCWAFIWGVGGALAQEGHRQFQEIVKEGFQGVHLPRCQSVFDFTINQETLASFVGWQGALSNTPFEFNRTAGFFSLLVPTVSTLKTQHFFGLLHECGRPLLLTGSSGAGKTVTLADFIRRQQAVVQIGLNFSAQTKAKSIQLGIQSKLFKKGKTLFGARPKQRIVVFVDEINMPAVDAFGSIPPIELLRQLIDKGGVYEIGKFYWKEVVDTSFYFVGANPGGGRNQLPNRFLRHFHILCMGSPSNSVLQQIFSQILTNFYQPDKEAVGLAADLIKATLQMYSKVRDSLLPTPAKFHYLFTSRDPARVIQGLTACKQNHWKFWAYEVQRVFADRIGDLADLDYFMQALAATSDAFGLYLKENELRKLLMTDLLQLQSLEVQTEEVTDPRKLVQMLESELDEMGSGKSLVFFENAISSVVKISRVLRKQRGNLLLIGLAGSGKETLSVLAAFVVKQQWVRLGTDPFRQQLQAVSKTAGSGVPLCYLAKDVKESHLQDLGSLINSGQIAGLFAKKEEVEQLLNLVRKEALAAKVPDSAESLYGFFLARLRDNLHLVFCISPVGDFLRLSCRKFPALISCCNLVWFWDWPEAALREIATKELADLLPREQLSPFVQLTVALPVSVGKVCENFWKEAGRKVYLTPQSFLDQLKLFSLILGRRKESLQHQKRILMEGVHKLDETNEKVAFLETKMKELKPMLVVQSQKAESAMKQLLEQKGDVNLRQAIVSEEASVIEGQRQEISLMVDEVNKELDKVLPLLRQAQEAIGRISKSDIAELKKYTSPPPPISMVLESVCVLLGEKTDWASVKRIIGELDFFDKIKSLEPGSIQEHMLRKLKAYTGNPAFDPLLVGKSSEACRSLCLWAKAFDAVARVSKELEPKKQQAAVLEKQLKEKNYTFNLKNEELKKVRARVQRLQKEFEVTSQRRQKIEEDKVETEGRLDRAAKLQLLLGDEEKRWRQQIQDLASQQGSIEGDSLLSAGVISFLGPFSKAFRDSTLASWLQSAKDKIKLSPKFSLSKILQTPLRALEWQTQGLPVDSFSVENACIFTHTFKSCYFIDPEGQAVAWLLKQGRFTAVKVGGGLLKQLQLALVAGQQLILEEAGESLQQSLSTILTRSAKQKQVKLGEMKAVVHPQFRLVMTTSKQNPKLDPEVFIQTTVINFCTTFEGLTDQLLGLVVRAERPSLQQERTRIVLAEAQGKRGLKEAQDLILKTLSQSQTLILDNHQLIQTLQASKAKSHMISQSLKENAVVQGRIDFERHEFQPVATRAAVLYFVVTDLSKVESMYQHSLSYFRTLFQNSIRLAPSADSPQLRKEGLISSVTIRTFAEVSRGLFQNHKKIFAFLIASGIERQEGTLSADLWRVFLRGPGFYKKEPKDPQVPDRTWISENTWNELLATSKLLPELSTLPLQVRNNIASYKWLLSGDQFMKIELPNKFKMTPFERLYVVKVLKPEAFPGAMVQYFVATLGDGFKELPQQPVQQFILQSAPTTPALFILSPGVDPSSAILKAAAAVPVPVFNISLGQGQGRKAEALIQKGLAEGGWILLQNCHLSRSWLPTLEQLVGSFSPQKTNPEFRLVMTSMPSQHFPSGLLQNSNKLTSQPPKGFRANLRKSLAELDGWPQEDQSMMRLLFGLCVFHGIVQERRKFGALGFNIRYQFNDNDLQIAKLTLGQLVQPAKPVPFEALVYLIGHIHYGGRVTDDNDRLTLLTTLRKFCFPELLLPQAQLACFYLPDELNLAAMGQFCAQLPDDQPLEIYGLHSNAGVAFNKQQAKMILSAILSTEKTAIEEIGNNLTAMTAEFQKELPQRLSAQLGQFHKPADPVELSLIVFLRQQVEKYNRLLTVISASLKDLALASKGLVLVSEDLQEMAVALSRGAIPRLWKKAAYSSLKRLGLWFQDLKQRVAFLRGWVSTQHPLLYWLGGLYFPQGFLTAVLQAHARKHKLAVDSLSFKFKATEEKDLKTPKDGVFIGGLFLDGASYDLHEDSLLDQKAGQMYCALPPVKFEPAHNYETPEVMHRLPCYKTADRVGVLSTTGQSTNFVTFVELPSKKDRQQTWVLRGAAVLCQLEQ